VSRFSNIHMSRIFGSCAPQSFKNRYKGARLERARDLFVPAVEQVLLEDVKSLYLQYTKLDEDYEFARPSD
jgi:hypothetical protein